jgi:hypothetical protein
MSSFSEAMKRAVKKSLLGKPSPEAGKDSADPTKPDIGEEPQGRGGVTIHVMPYKPGETQDKPTLMTEPMNMEHSDEETPAEEKAPSEVPESEEDRKKRILKLMLNKANSQE